MNIICELFETIGDNGMIKISVKDTGVGIGQEDQNKLFRLFGFLEATHQINTKGIGLGLYICKKIVTIFGGTVSVESEINKGSTFHFSFMLSPNSLQVGGIIRNLSLT